MRSTAAEDEPTPYGWVNGSLSVPAERIREARRHDMDDLLRLTTPPIAAEVSESYAVEVDPILEDDSAVLVLGRGIIGTISRPVAQVANQLEGSTVITSDGSDIGVITEIMVDMDEGQVPYVMVLSTGGFLGTYESFVPIPPRAQVEK